MKEPVKKSNVYHSKAHRGEVRRNRLVLALLVLLFICLVLGCGYLIARAVGGRGDSGVSSAVSSENAVSSAVSVSSSSESVSSASEAEPESAAEPESESVSEPEPESEPAAEPESVPAPAPEPEPAAPALWDVTGEEGYPYLLAVNRATQTVTVYGKDGEGNYTVPTSSMICSTGTYTPVGEFHTTDQYTWRYLEGGVYGQYATRITGHILFHSVPYFSQDKGDLESEEFNKLGTPASLGCVRLQVKDCKWIYEACPSGTPVVIFDGDSAMDPLGNPGFTALDLQNPNAGWDPTDPDPQNPWNL